MVYYRSLTGVMAGLWVQSAEVTSEQESYDVTRTGWNRQIVSGPRHINMRITLMGEGAMFEHSVLELGHQLVALGDGKLCPACGTYWPTGNYLCFNCGCELDTYPYLRPDAIGGTLASINLVMPVGALITCDLEVVALSHVPDGLLAGSLGSLHTLEHLGILNQGYYLCAWCGLAVEDGKPCFGCGGPRTPLRELVDMDHECLWCGNDTVNGIMCERCGTRVGGRTIEEVL